MTGSARAKNRKKVYFVLFLLAGLKLKRLKFLLAIISHRISWLGYNRNRMHLIYGEPNLQ